MSHPGSDPVPGFHHLVLPSQGLDVAPVLKSVSKFGFDQMSGVYSSPSQGCPSNVASYPSANSSPSQGCLSNVARFPGLVMLIPSFLGVCIDFPSQGKRRRLNHVY